MRRARTTAALVASAIMASTAMTMVTGGAAHGATNLAPVAAFTATPKYLTARLDASASTDSDGRVATYAWTFGDGTAGTGQKTSHEYTRPGTYTVRLTVTDDGGLRATKTLRVKVVANVAPTASFTAKQTYLAVRLDASGSSDSDGTLAGTSWTFGDGSTGTGRYVTHTYARSGTFPITLTVKDDAGATHTTTQHVTVVANKAPTASFVSTQRYLTTRFDASASTDDGRMVFTWDFGDGTTGVGRVVSHSYAAAGPYRATLTVTDDAGAVARLSKSTIAVANIPPTVTTLHEVDYLFAEFRATGTVDPDGYVTAYHWDFGDGTSVTGKFVDHTYAASGTYRVTLSVTDSGGALVSTTIPVTVAANELPTATFVGKSSLRTARFDASASVDPEGAMETYAWDFGDGTTGTGQHAWRTYRTAGTYQVTLTVTDSGGGTDVATRTVTVSPAPAPGLGLTNGSPGERPDERAIADFGAVPDVASTYYPVDRSVNVVYETARIRRGTAPCITKAVDGRPYLAGIAAGDPVAMAWLNQYVAQLKQLAKVNPKVPVYGTIEHEFSAKVQHGHITGPSADPLVYAKALSIFIRKAHAAHPNIKATMWLVGWDREMEGIIGEALTERPDVITFDSYANDTTDTVASIATPELDWARAQPWYDGQPIGLTEFGIPVALGDEAAARFYTAVRPQLDSVGVAWAIMFNRPRDKNYEITNATGQYDRAVAAFAASLAG